MTDFNVHWPSTSRFAPIEGARARDRRGADDGPIDKAGGSRDTAFAPSVSNTTEASTRPSLNSIMDGFYDLLDAGQSRVVGPPRQAFTTYLTFLEDTGKLMALLGRSTSAGSDSNHIKVDIKAVKRELDRLKDTWGVEVERGPEPLEKAQQYAKDHGLPYVDNHDGTGTVLKETSVFGPKPLKEVKEYAEKNGLSYKDNGDGTGVALKGKVVYGPASLDDIKRYAEKWRLPYKVNADGKGVVLVNTKPLDVMLEAIANETDAIAKAKPPSDGKIDWLVGQYQAWNTTMTTQYQQIESESGLLAELSRSGTAMFNNIFEGIISIVKSFGDVSLQYTRGIG
jgi:hypothetical protein